MKIVHLFPVMGLTVAAIAPVAGAPVPAINSRVDALLGQSLLTATGADAVKQRCDAVLALGAEAKAALEARKGKAAVDTDWAAYDTLSLILGDGSAEMSLMSETNPAKPVREAAEACYARISEAATAVGLSRPIYDRLSAIQTAGLDPATRYTVDHALTAYRLTGVDKDAAVRRQVETLQKAATEAGLKFAANIRNDKGDVTFTTQELAGLPQDWLDAHKPGADGLVHLTFDYPDVFPALRFATNRATRLKLMSASDNRGWPANDATLRTLLEKRYAMAKLLGFPNYAAQATADKMIGSPERAAAFLDEVNVAAKPGADADYAELQGFAASVDPSITRVERWDSSYLSNLLRKQKYNVDAAEVRQYFTLEKTRKGIFQLVHDLFGSDIVPWDTPVWDKSVTAWELRDGGKVIGRFYLDMSPREGKFSHAAQFTVRTGIAGRQLPVGALVTNFPATGPMDHGDVDTFLHEFGHLIHFLYSGHVRWNNQSMNALQWDFIEAPSQMLEEWAWNYDTLKTFASNDKGEPIPADLVARMNRGRKFGESIGWKNQLGYAAISLNFYNRAPDFSLDAMTQEQLARYALFRQPPGSHMYASFGHLDGYSAIYYTYVWSKAIALDMFTRFKADGMRNKATAMDYRRKVLEPGGSMDANALIQSFLGRQTNMDAFRDDLAQK
ncbi:MAG: M3 family metallopeptidase [Sphingobium sp.]